MMRCTVRLVIGLVAAGLVVPSVPLAQADPPVPVADGPVARPPSIPDSDDVADGAPPAPHAGALDVSLRGRTQSTATMTVEVLTDGRPVSDLVRTLGGTVLREFAGRALVRLRGTQLRLLSADDRITVVRTPPDVRGAMAEQRPAMRTEGGDWSSPVPSQSIFGWDGTGEKIGLIGLFDPALLDQKAAAGEIRAIPAAQRYCIWNGVPCTFGSPGATWSIGLLEIVSDAAPGPDLYVAELNAGLDYVAAIDWFAAQGVTTVMHTWSVPLDGPGDGTGFSAAVVDYAVSKGILWVNTAGTLGADYQYTKYQGPHWSGTWKDSNGNRYMEWSGTDESLGVYCGWLTGVRWSDWGAAKTDYDLYISDYRAATRSNGSKVLASAFNQATGGAAPLEGNDFRPMCNTDPANGPVYDTNGDGFISLWLYRTTRSSQSPTGDRIDVVLSGGWLEYANSDRTVAVPFVDTRNEGALIVSGSVGVGGGVPWYMSSGLTNDGRMAIDLTAPTCVTTSFTGVAATCADAMEGGAPATASVAAAAAVSNQYLGTPTPQQVARFLTTEAQRWFGPRDDARGWGPLRTPRLPGYETVSPGELRLLPAPQRILETRANLGLIGTSVPGPLAPDTWIPLFLSQVPHRSTALLNVTIVNSTGPGWVQVFPDSWAAIGQYSSLNVPVAGANVPNLVAVAKAAGTTIYTSGGGHIIVDLLGWFEPIETSNSPAGRFEPVEPFRVFDTETCLGAAPSCSGAKVAAGSFTDVTLAGVAEVGNPDNGIPSTDLYAAVVSVTAAAPTTRGYISVLPEGASTVPTSTINPDAGQQVTGMAIVPISEADPTIRLFSSTATHLRLDVLGYFRIGDGNADHVGTFVPSLPRRLLDTRSGAKPAAGAEITIDTTASTTGRVAAAAWLNVVGVLPAAPGEILVDANSPVPGSHTNVSLATAGRNLASALITPLTENEAVARVSSSMHVVVDQTGWFYLEAPMAAPGQVTTIELPDGSYPDADFTLLDISADGQRLLLAASSVNIDGLGTGQQLLVHDRTDHSFTRVDPGPGFAAALPAEMSDNGRFVLFSTTRALLPSDTDAASDVYLYDLASDDLSLVGLGHDEQNPTGGVISGGVSDDGNVLLLSSPGSPGFPSGIAIRNRAAGTTTAIPASSFPALLADGSAYVTTGPTRVAYLNTDWVRVDKVAINGSIIASVWATAEGGMVGTITASPDGNYATVAGYQPVMVHFPTKTFELLPYQTAAFPRPSNGPNAVHPDGVEALFPEPHAATVWSRQLGSVNVQLTWDGSPANGAVQGYKHVSANGDTVVFASAATNLVEGVPADGRVRIYFFDMTL